MSGKHGLNIIYLVQVLSVMNIIRLTTKERVKIMKSYYKDCDYGRHSLHRAQLIAINIIDRLVTKKIKRNLMNL